jgi:hypothetical protein
MTAPSANLTSIHTQQMSARGQARCFSRGAHLSGVASKAEVIVTRMGRDSQGQAWLSAAK